MLLENSLMRGLTNFKLYNSNNNYFFGLCFPNYLEGINSKPQSNSPKITG